MQKKNYLSNTILLKEKVVCFSIKYHVLCYKCTNFETLCPYINEYEKWDPNYIRIKHRTNIRHILYNHFHTRMKIFHCLKKSKNFHFFLVKLHFKGKWKCFLSENYHLFLRNIFILLQKWLYFHSLGVKFYSKKFRERNSNCFKDSYIKMWWLYRPRSS